VISGVIAEQNEVPAEQSQSFSSSSSFSTGGDGVKSKSSQVVDQAVSDGSGVHHQRKARACINGKCEDGEVDDNKMPEQPKMLKNIQSNMGKMFGGLFGGGMGGFGGGMAGLGGGAGGPPSVGKSDPGSIGDMDSDMANDMQDAWGSPFRSGMMGGNLMNSPAMQAMQAGGSPMMKESSSSFSSQSSLDGTGVHSTSNQVVDQASSDGKEVHHKRKARACINGKCEDGEVDDNKMPKEPKMMANMQNSMARAFGGFGGLFGGFGGTSDGGMDGFGFGGSDDLGQNTGMLVDNSKSRLEPSKA
jgi:hypothetical protein